MKKTFLAMILAGSSIAMFAQTPTTNPTPPTTPTTSPTTTPTTNPTSPTTSPTTIPTSPTTSPTTNPTSPTTSPATLPPTTTSPTTNPPTTNGNVTNSTTDPMKTTTNPTMNNGNMNTNGTMNNSTWNTGTPTNLGWTNYGIWNNAATVNGVNATTGNNMNNATMNNGNMNATGNYNNSASNNAYGATVATIPYRSQMEYSKSYPTAASSNATWTQYGDWFYTTYMSNGRYSQIFYDQRGNGYSLALPVLNTYVPENVVAMALQKYGSTLYSITMIKSAEGKDAYQINLLDRGQPKIEWVGDDGASAMNIYRTEEMNAAMSNTQTNAAMDNSSGTTSSDNTLNKDNATTTDPEGQDATDKGMDKKMKSKTKNADGTDMKSETKPGKEKMKMKPKGNMQ